MEGLTCVGCDRTLEEIEACGRMYHVDQRLFSLFEAKPLVVYHGTHTDFRQFSLKNAPQRIIWFSSDRAEIEAGESGAQGASIIVTAQVTLNKPAGWAEYDKLMLDQIQRQGYDGVILPEKNGHFNCFVFSPKQVKIIKKERVK